VNFCIRQIRKALGESARNHRYIETLHRRGYRFKVPVTTVESLTGTDFASFPESQLPRKPRSRRVLPSCHSVIWVTARQVNWPMELQSC
jgi:DNA-binding winged helix-turn-helix (wHTH) protein